MATHEQLLARVKALTILVKSQGDAHLAIQSLAQETLKDPKYRGVLQDALEDADHPHKDFHKDPVSGMVSPQRDRALVQHLANPEHGHPDRHYLADQVDRGASNLNSFLDSLGRDKDRHSLFAYAVNTPQDHEFYSQPKDRLKSVAAHITGRKPGRMDDLVVFDAESGPVHGQVLTDGDTEGTVRVYHGSIHPGGVRSSIQPLNKLRHQATEVWNQIHAQGAQE